MPKPSRRIEKSVQRLRPRARNSEDQIEQALVQKLQQLYGFETLNCYTENPEDLRDSSGRAHKRLESVIAGLFPQQKLLDYIENFVLYYKDNQKIIAQNYQFIGVNHAYDTFLRREELQGKLGVFWHTQGSGKSFSMIFYVRKIFRKQTGNFSFVVVTDHDDLDGQIYRNFLHTGTVSKAEAAQPSEEGRRKKEETNSPSAR